MNRLRLYPILVLIACSMAAFGQEPVSDGFKVSGEQISAPTASLTNMLYGKFPGLFVTESTGEPGYDAATLNIRGIATYNNTEIPIYVDGFQINSSFFNYMSAAEIESIRILKDAADLAPFGQRGANGIIWVTTKRGASHNGPIVSFEAKGGIQQAANINKPYGTDDFMRLYNEAYSNDLGAGWTDRYSAAEIAKMPDVDWHDAVLKPIAPYYESNLSIRGGDKNVRYFVAAGYMDQDGLYDVPFSDTLSNASISRINLRSNLDINLADWIEASIGIGGRIENRRYPNMSASTLWTNMAKYPSFIYPIKNTDGSWTGTPVYNNNPVASIRALGKNSTHDRTLQFQLALKEKLDFLLEGLYLRESIALSSWTRDAAGNTRNYTRMYNGAAQTTDNDTPYSRYENSGTNQWNWKHFKLGTGYSKNIGPGLFSANIDGLYNIYNTDINQNGDAGSHLFYRYANISGAFTYDVDGLFYAAFTYALSGSDNYRPGNKWGFYPALSVGYTILKDVLKVRADAGLNGWDPMGEKRFLWERYYTHNGGINLGNGSPSWHSGFTTLYEANPDIFSEKSAKASIGVDASLMNHRLNAEVTGFFEKRNGIVTQNTMIPGAAGIQNPAYENLGKVTNMGLDLALSYADKIGDFKYGASLIGSYATNRIDYMAEVITISSRAKTGHPINSIFGYVADGFYDVSDFDADGNLLPGLPKVSLGEVQPGDIKYKNLTPDDIIDELDQTIIGSPRLPKLNYSLTISLGYRNFDLSVMFYGIGGSSVNLLDAPIQSVAFRDNGNVFKIAEGRWAYYPEKGIDTRGEATYPRLSLLDNNNNYQYSTLWVHSGDFFKLKDVELGYTLPEALLSKAGIERIRVYARALNLFTISRLMKTYGIDPEVMAGHPAMRPVNLGVNVTF